MLSYIFNTEGFITGIEIAKIFNVSVRTIQYDIKEINNLLKEYNTKIHAVVKKGYCLDDKSKEILREKNIIRSIIDFEYINETPMTPFERQMFILSKLTVQEYITVEELEGKLFVSISTINKDILSATAWLKENLDINLHYSLSKGVGIEATEKEKRNIISWILSYKLNISTLEKQWKYLFEGKEHLEDFGKIYSIVETIANQYGYYLSGHSLQLYCVEIIIASTRQSMGLIMEEGFSAELKPVILALRKSLMEKMNINLSKIAWINLQEYFLSKQFLSGTWITNMETVNSTAIVSEFLAVLKNMYQVDLTADHPLMKEKLVLYVAPMINRLKLRHTIANKMSGSVIHTHPYEYKMASEMADIVKDKLNVFVHSSEIAYIALHIASIKRIWRQKLNAIIVCDYDESVISYLKDRIVNQLEDKLKLLGCYSYQQFTMREKESFREVDIIITTSNLADKTTIPFFQISIIVTKKDISNLNEYLKEFEQVVKR